jgi:hypothetical protein
MKNTTSHGGILGGSEECGTKDKRDVPYFLISCNPMKYKLASVATAPWRTLKFLVSKPK